jgi:hypothetical protein
MIIDLLYWLVWALVLGAIFGALGIVGVVIWGISENISAKKKPKPPAVEFFPKDKVKERKRSIQFNTLRY